jgi:ER lumen protein retaining receptor
MAPSFYLRGVVNPYHGWSLMTRKIICENFLLYFLAFFFSSSSCIMNIFRVLGDGMHLASLIVLLRRITNSKNCAGISLKSQVLYALVFTARYADLLMYFVSIYNTMLKVFFLMASYAVVYYIVVRFHGTYNEESDGFRVIFLVIPAAVLALIFNEKFELFEIVWSFSIYLESVAILPQLYMLSKMKEMETMTSHYVFLLGGYRGMYILNWIWRYVVNGVVSKISWFAGVVQTLIYVDFFYIYYKTYDGTSKHIHHTPRLGYVKKTSDQLN